MTLKVAQSFVLILTCIVAFSGFAAPVESVAEDTPHQAEALDYTKEFDESLTEERTSVNELLQQTIGTTTRSLRFDWRKSPIHVGLTAGQLLELNNFNSWRTGATLRVPLEDFLIDLQASYVYVRDSRSSELMALTPYRQAGRPTRFELDLGLQWPIAEGVVTPRFNWLPTVDLSLSLYAGIRYFIYPGIYRFDGVLQTVRQLLSTELTTDELADLEDTRLLAMDVVPNRYSSLAGFSTDIYMRFGLFFNLKTLIHIPIGSNETVLNAWWWYELSASMGMAF